MRCAYKKKKLGPLTVDEYSPQVCIHAHIPTHTCVYIHAYTHTHAYTHSAKPTYTIYINKYIYKYIFIRPDYTYA